MRSGGGSGSGRGTGEEDEWIWWAARATPFDFPALFRPARLGLGAGASRSVTDIEEWEAFEERDALEPDLSLRSRPSRAAVEAEGGVARSSTEVTLEVTPSPSPNPCPWPAK